MNIQLIIDAMQEKHVSPEQLSNSCGVSRPTIERILNGSTSNPGILTMCDICVSLGLSLDEIMDMPAAAHGPVPGAAGPAQSAELSNLYRAVIHVKDAWIKRLAIACAVLVGFDLLYLVLDIANPSAGWVTEQSSNVANVCRVLVVVALIVGVLASVVISTKNSKARRP